MIIDVSRPKNRKGFAATIGYNCDKVALRAKSAWEIQFNIADSRHPELTMECTATQSPWCRHPEFKFVISWPYGERPSRFEVVRVVYETLREASRFCHFSDGGQPDLTELELVLNGHDNTDHFHVHGVLNLIHPVTLRAVEMNAGYDQILFQHSLRIVELRLDWSTTLNNPRYEPNAERTFVRRRLNPLPEKQPDRRQVAFEVFRNAEPPEIALRRILHGISPETLGSAQHIDRFLQSRSIHYQTVKRSSRGNVDPNIHSAAFFTLDGHRIPSSRIRDDQGRSTWTPSALRRILPKLSPSFELGYPLSKMRNRRRRKSKKVIDQEWSVIAAELQRSGRMEIRAAETTFANLGVEHFIVHAELPSLEFRYRPNPADRSMPSGFNDRFPVSSLDDLDQIAERLRVAEDRGARIKFLPVRSGVVYATAVGLDANQLRVLQQKYATAFIVKEAGGNYSVFVAAKALPDHDTCMAALRIMNAEIHAEIYKKGLPPPPVFPMLMPGFRTMLGEWLPGDPPVVRAELVAANQQICPAASKRLESIGRHYTQVILPKRGTLFAVALRRLAQISQTDEHEFQFKAVATAHLTDLQTKATPPANWEEVDRCLAIRLLLSGFGEKAISDLIAKFALLTRSAAERLPADRADYAKSVARWAQNASDLIPLLQNMATGWEILTRSALNSGITREPEIHQPPNQRLDDSQIKTVELPTVTRCLDADVEPKVEQHESRLPPTR